VFAIVKDADDLEREIHETGKFILLVVFVAVAANPLISLFLAPTDFAMDLIIALEMSRLQLIEYEVRQQNYDQTATSNTDFQASTMDGYSEDAQIRLAIFFSLEESGKHVTATGVAGVVVSDVQSQLRVFPLSWLGLLLGSASHLV
jgi:hypothetical protein